MIKRMTKWMRRASAPTSRFEFKFSTGRKRGGVQERRPLLLKIHNLTCILAQLVSLLSNLISIASDGTSMRDIYVAVEGRGANESL